jgi:hypothetical protein
LFKLIGKFLALARDEGISIAVKRARRAAGSRVSGNPGEKGLHQLIPPEIEDDEFARAIKTILSSDLSIRTILEIGSSSGEGSTQAIVQTIRRRSNPPKLFCMDISETRYRKLKHYYRKYPFVHAYNQSSVPLNEFMRIADIERFLLDEPRLHIPGVLDNLRRWLAQDRDYITRHQIPQNGIRTIMNEHHIDQFDFVLIDGSAFTAPAELRLVYGANYLFLDDINDIKNLANYRHLYADPFYELIAQNWFLRAGFAAFKRRDHESQARADSSHATKNS